jgi:transcriptional regulator GlxA family with amidase domain
VLAQAGVLDGRRATTHWLLAKEFQTAFPQVRLEPDQLYVDDGPVHTSGGLFAAADLALHLLALDQGDAYANDFGRLLVTAPRRPGAQAQFIKRSLRVDNDLPLSTFLQWIREHAHEPLTLEQLATHQHISQRSLIRKFRQATGMSVFDWIAQKRVNQAKVLLETTDFAISEIAAMVGFGTAETLRRNFDRRVATTPGAYRSTFRRLANRPDPWPDLAG